MGHNTSHATGVSGTSGSGGARRPTRPLLRGRADSLDHEIISLFFALMESFKEHFFDAAKALDLTLPQAHLLMNLDEPVPMRDLAEVMGYDASHITSLVDRLEERDLVERRPDPADRRIKRILITEKGSALRARIEDQLFETIPPLNQLTKAERMQLRDLLSAATADVSRQLT